MSLKHSISKVRCLLRLSEAPEVLDTIADELSIELDDLAVKLVPSIAIPTDDGELMLSVVSLEDFYRLTGSEAPADRDAVYFKLSRNGAGCILATHRSLLFSFTRYLLDVLVDEDERPFAEGKVFKPAFPWQRVSYDYFLTQEGRITQDLDRESYVRQLALMGLTHIEVNGLGSPMGIETGPPGEIYPMFYTYCPALDQFVYSELNQGLYPYYYLSANLNYLKENARLAKSYGLTPGLLCFEPRSVPERFFDRYPMLRGCRVDHPFRSFKPRYNMTITHPLVREHYAEMMRKLAREVPELGFINIWTNDSGAGFEHTKSLYVGRNGGAYLVREWKDDAEIARLAGENALRFLRTLRDAGREINPDFRVITRMESFYGEHDTVWAGLEDGLEIETNSLAARGWAMPYKHPLYPDNDAVNGGSVYQQGFVEAEKVNLADVEARGSQAHFYFGAGPETMFAPLMGVPYPRLTWQRLKELHDNGVRRLVQYGGTFPPEQVPFNVNHEIVRRFQFDPEMDIDVDIEQLAKVWVGEDFAGDLTQAWAAAEEGILAFPNTSTLYSTIGFTWYRLWARPFAPNLEAIPSEERAYYEQFICTTPHNPNNVDLSRDVLFHLTTVEKSRLDVERMDTNLWQPLDRAIAILHSAVERAGEDSYAGWGLFDQEQRLRGLRCWFMTHRNLAAWIAGVYGYMEAATDGERAQWRDYLRDSIRQEIANTQDLMEVLDSGVPFLALTDKGETPLMYGSNLRGLLPHRIELMEQHIDDEPFIDHHYIERQAGKAIE